MPCYGCEAKKETVHVRERRPGSRGGMSQSFAGNYALCQDCLAKCKEVGAIESWEEKTKKPRRDERVTVYARTLQWLRAQARGIVTVKASAEEIKDVEQAMPQRP